MSFFLTFEGLLSVGAFVGFWLGLAIPFERKGCSLLLVVPIGALVFVAGWHEANTEALRSTSALDFFFVPLWSSIGALAGYCIGSFVGGKWRNRN